jgi:outer membrane protein assembly factor BamA
LTFLAASAQSQEDSASSVVSTELLKSHDKSVNVYPYAFYNPEVKLAFGAGGVITFYTSDDSDLRPSKISLSGYYSTSKQYKIGFSPQVYLFGNRVFASIKLFVQDKTIFTPDTLNPEIDSKAWGVKTELLIPALLGFNNKDSRRKLGIIFDYQNVDISDDNQDPSGEVRPHTLGIGAAWVLDSRDNIFYPTTGHLHRFQFMIFSKDLGSSYDFNRFEIDLRQYFPINQDKRQLIAVQAFADFARGHPPFYRLPAFGGSKIMRGFKSGSFRDRTYIASQVEFRTHMWWKLGAVAFVGAGDIAEELRIIKFGDLKYSYGVGLRFVFNEKEGINLRADLGFGEDTNGLYITVEEAF